MSSLQGFLALAGFQTGLSQQAMQAQVLRLGQQGILQSTHCCIRLTQAHGC